MLKVITDNPLDLEYVLESGMIYSFPFTINNSTIQYNLYHFCLVSDYSLNATISKGVPVNPVVTFRSGTTYFPILQRNIPLIISDILEPLPYPNPESIKVTPGQYYLNVHNLRGFNNILRIVVDGKIPDCQVRKYHGH